ncbi:MAG TPA: ATP-binding protein [Geobacteraceae bacterium]
MFPAHHSLETKIANGMVGLILVWLCVEGFLDTTGWSPRTEQLLHLGMVAVLLAILIMRGLVTARQRRERETLSRENEAMQQQVEKSSLRYKHLLEGAGDAIFVVDAANGELEEMNSPASAMLGYSRAELGTLFGRQLIPLRDQAEFISLVRRVNRLGMASLDRITIKRKDGSRFLGEVNARLIDLGDSRVVQAIVRDVTHKWKTEEELKERNRRLALLNGIIARVNESLDLQTVLQSTIREVLAAFNCGAGTIHLTEKGGAALSLAAGHNLPARFVDSIASFAQDNKVPCPVASSRRCHAVTNLATVHCRFAVLAAEEGWKSIVGIPLVAQQRLVGVMHIMASAPWKNGAENHGFFSSIGNQIGIAIDHARMYTELNRKNEELLRSHHLLEKNSLHLARTQNRLERNLAMEEAARQELERLGRMKGQFLGMVSHEFRTPLTGILSSVEFLLANRGQVAAGEEQELLEMIQFGGKRLNEIVTNLLKVVRLEAKGAALSRCALQLATLLGSVREQIGPLLERRKQRIILHELEEIPFFYGDREHLEEVFTELLVNAIKFTPDGGEITLSATVTDRNMVTPEREAILRRFNPQFWEAMGSESYLQVEVRDSGIGIAHDDQLKIFDTFYEVGDIRHHSSGKHKFQGKGTGMGLAIVKGMIEAHGGMVWVESPNTAGEGSTFFLLLPLEEETGQQRLFPLSGLTPSLRKPYDDPVLPPCGEPPS